MQGTCVLATENVASHFATNAAEALNAPGFIPNEDDFGIIKHPVNIQTCDVLFQYSLARVDRLGTASHLFACLSRSCTSLSVQLLA